jgi:Bacterial regulatory proteins, luxR family
MGDIEVLHIAAELFVSSNTVPTHLRHIYAKLDAHSRNEAVARARQLGAGGARGPPALSRGDPPNHAERVMTGRPAVADTPERQHIAGATRRKGT